MPLQRGMSLANTILAAPTPAHLPSSSSGDPLDPPAAQPRVEEQAQTRRHADFTTLVKGEKAAFTVTISGQYARVPGSS